MSWAVALCLLATSELPTSKAVARFADCVQLAERAAQAGHEPSLIVSLGVEESGLDSRATSRCGARGILQAIPRWHCPDGVERDCDLVAAGLRAVERWQSRAGDAWLCHYNAGNDCGARARAYARRITRRADSWKRRLDAAEEQTRGQAQ